MIGSNSKAFTATALAILDAEKKLSLDDKVQKWLPDFLNSTIRGWQKKPTSVICFVIASALKRSRETFMYFDSDLSTAEVREKMAKAETNVRVPANGVIPTALL